MFEFLRQHDLLELFGRCSHRAISLSERTTFHSFILQVNDGLGCVPSVVCCGLQVELFNDLQDVSLDKVIVKDITSSHFHISLRHPFIIVNVLLAYLLQHLLLRNPKEGQQLESFILMEEQHKGCDVRYIGQIKTAPALASS